jgi:intracellular multiplication protein IcmW
LFGQSQEYAMPDLSLKACQQFWHEYQDPSIYRVVTFMEAVEDWALDGDPDLEAAIAQLGTALDDLGAVDLQREEDLILLATYIKASRNLRLLQALDTAHPGAASKLLMYAENNSYSMEDLCGLFLRRNIVFERLRLLTRVLAPERFELLRKVLEE